MYTIITNRELVHIPHDKLKKRLGTDQLYKSPIWMSYVEALELKASVNGEEATLSLLSRARNSVIMDDDAEEEEDESTFLFIFACNDGLIRSKYRAATLSRHFRLIEAYLEDNPGELYIPFEKYSRADVMLALDGYFNGDVRLRDALDVLQLLTPQTTWGYFDNYTWNDMRAKDLLQLSRLFTQDDLALFHESERLRNGYDAITMPRLLGFPGYTILSGLEQARAYSVDEEEEALKLFPASFVAGAQIHSLSISQKLIDSDFSAYAGVPNRLAAGRLIDNLYYIITKKGGGLSRESLIRLMTMLGLKSPLLGNEDVDLLLPYQLIPDYENLQRNLQEIVSSLDSDWKSRADLYIDLERYVPPKEYSEDYDSDTSM